MLHWINISLFIIHPSYNLPGLYCNCIAVHCIEMYFGAMLCIVQYCAVPYRALSCWAVLCCIILNAPYCIVLRCLALHCAAMHCTVLLSQTSLLYLKQCENLHIQCYDVWKKPEKYQIHFCVTDKSWKKCYKIKPFW